MADTQPEKYYTLFRENLSPGQMTLSVILFVTLCLIDVYSLPKLFNLIRSLIATSCFTAKPIEGGTVPEGSEPTVTIQICAYNEASVIEATINAACRVDWPKEKLYVQICDDSTDETTDIIQAACVKWQEKGVHCQLMRRCDRIGYKAGSLHYHTKSVQGDFVALFDSDHRAEPSFLRRAIPQFYDSQGNPKKNIGLVQLPWAYYNTHQNILTEYDALGLDVSHVVEQTGRAAALKCFGFNGTGGVWRREAVQAGGGWQWDTVTEDLDLSYLARLEGYDFVYLRDLPQQLELPSGIRAHVQQKHRWTKGYFQVMRKSLWNIFTSPKCGFAVKYEAFFHFTGMPLAWIGATPVFILATCSYATVYGKVSGSNGHYNNLLSRTFRAIFIFPLTVILGLGMCVFETYAMVDGLTSNDATFKRTPKEGSSMFTIVHEDGSDIVPVNRPSRVTTSVLDFVKEEDQEDEDEVQVQDTQEAGLEENEAPIITEVSEPKKGGKSKKKRAFFGLVPRKYFKDVILGLTGLGVAGYLIGWFLMIMFHSPKFNAISFFVLAPVPGLLYVHGSFCLALLQPALVKKWKRWQSKKTFESGISSSQEKEADEEEDLPKKSIVEETKLEEANIRQSDSRDTLYTLWSGLEASSSSDDSKALEGHATADSVDIHSDTKKDDNEQDDGLQLADDSVDNESGGDLHNLLPCCGNTF